MLHRAVVRDFGEPNRVVELERYTPGELEQGHVRVRMTMSAINPSDLITISGAYRSRTPLPFLPGFEGVGVVTEVGTGASRVKPGQRVLPIGTAGCWQNSKDNAEDWCLAVPDRLSDESAATSYVNPMTAWVMLNEAYGIRPGMKIAVSAAGSAIGQMIIRLANIIGIVPIAFYRSETSGTRLSALKVERVQYENSRSLAEICTHWLGPKVDVIFDCIGGEDAVSLAKIVTPGGQFIHYGLLSGQPIPSASWPRHELNLHLFHLRSWIRQVPIEYVQQIYDRVSALIVSGEICTLIRARYQLDDITTALEDALVPSPNGKVMLRL